VNGLYLPPDVEYCVFGREVGPSGTPHIQGYLVLPQKKTLKWLKAQNSSMARCHWEQKVPRSTPLQASDYCKKDGDWVEVGVLPITAADSGGAGNKRKWEDALIAAKEGRFDDIDAHIRLQYHRTIKQINQEAMLEKSGTQAGELENLWYHGPPGTGKSRKAREDYPDAYLKALNHWWDGYRGEDTVIIEEWELTSGRFLGHHLKIWSDRYPFAPEIKGSHLPRQRPKRIIVTSNYSINDCFGADRQLELAINRRFTSVDFGLL